MIASPLVAVGISIPMADIAAIDVVAEKQGVSRSALLRSVIVCGLQEFMQGEPQLLARYRSVAQKPIRPKRRQHSYAAALNASQGAENGQYL